MWTRLMISTIWMKQRPSSQWLCAKNPTPNDFPEGGLKKKREKKKRKNMFISSLLSEGRRKWDSQGMTGDLIFLSPLLFGRVGGFFSPAFWPTTKNEDKAMISMRPLWVCILTAGLGRRPDCTRRLSSRCYIRNNLKPVFTSVHKPRVSAFPPSLFISLRYTGILRSGQKDLFFTTSPSIF